MLRQIIYCNGDEPLNAPSKLRQEPSLSTPGLNLPMLQRYLLFWLSLLCGVAYYWPTGRLGGFDPFLSSLPWLSYLIIVTMFAIGTLLPQDEVRQVAARWPTVLQGTVLQYTVMPLSAYLIGRLFGFEHGLMQGVVIVGCVPGAMASNVLTLAARGNVSYSVSLTTSATLLSPLCVPLAFWLFLSESTQLDPVAVGMKLMYQVVGPVVLGHLLSRRFPDFQRLMQTCGPVIANLAILWIVAAIFAKHRETITANAQTVGGALLIINLIGYLGGYWGGKLLQMGEPMRRALTLEIGMQNAGLGTVLAGGLYGEDSLATIPPALYTFGCMLTGTVLAQFWRFQNAGVEGQSDSTNRGGDSSIE